MRGRTVIEVTMMVVMVVVIAAVAVVFLSGLHHNHYPSAKLECLNNVRQIVGLLEMGAAPTDGYPRRRGTSLILQLVAREEIAAGYDDLAVLFCPGDKRENLEKAGGPAAYRGLDLSQAGPRGQLTSYAGRDQRDPECKAPWRGKKELVLVCDDSDDHHEDGFVVGLTSGAAKFRHRLDDWGLDEGAAVVVGPDSVVPELRCLRRD